MGDYFLRYLKLRCGKNITPVGMQNSLKLGNPETTRKWIKGKSVPDKAKLRLLAEVYGLDEGEVLLATVLDKIPSSYARDIWEKITGVEND